MDNSSPNKNVVTKSSMIKTGLTELPEFHPRLSMRSAVSAKINEDSLNLIEQRQNQTSPTPTDLFGGEFMSDITIFVGPDGIIKESTNLSEYAEFMQREVSSSQQVLLLKILVASINNNPELMSTRILHCESLMVLIGLWLNTVDQDKLLDSLLVGKILEILSKLDFSVEQLVKYKFGRVVKKITQQKDKLSPKLKTTNLDLALCLFDSWNSLASKSEISTVPRRKSEDNSTVQETIKSEVDVHKRALDFVSSEESKKMKTDNVSFNHPDKLIQIPTTRKVPRKVTFPDSPELLCKIIHFERDPEEYEYLSDGSASRDSYLHADVGEASAAFSHSDEDAEEYIMLKPWKSPELIEGILVRPEGMDCEEKIIQQQREKTVLSVTYFSINEIPPFPSEKDVDVLDTSDETVQIIPIRANESVVKQVIKLKTAPSLVIPSMFNPAIFSDIFSNNSYNSILNPFIKPNNSFSTDKAFNALNGFRGGSSPECPTYTPYNYTESRTSKKNNCRFYKSGRPSSCRLGSSCKFLHQD